jgi:Zn ribbon nucleic-acid-binding protein
LVDKNQSDCIGCGFDKRKEVESFEIRNDGWKTNSYIDVELQNSDVCLGEIERDNHNWTVIHKGNESKHYNQVYSAKHFIVDSGYICKRVIEPRIWVRDSCVHRMVCPCGYDAIKITVEIKEVKR